jgi:ethanolamine ammonia-lyase small subunit
MGKQLQIRLDRRDLGQLLDGLRARKESWEKTAEYLKSDCVSDDSFVCEECNDASEAAAIADHYAKIISRIKQQVKQQGGWS